MSIPSYNETEFNSRVIAERIQAAIDLHRDRQRDIWQAGERTITDKELRSNVEAVIADSLKDVLNPKPISVLRDQVFADLESICSKFPIVRRRLELIKGSELQNMVCKETEWLVKDLIPAVGATMLVSEPKAGKSWLSYMLALCVANGEAFLNRETRHGTVIYFDLEGKRKRSQLRASVMQMPIPDNLLTCYKADTLRGGLLETIQEIYDQMDEKPVLIIIDVYEKIADIRSMGQNAYEIGQANMGPIEDFALKNNLAVLCCHHTKKGNARDTDIFQNFIGGGSIFGCADAQLVLSRPDPVDKTRRVLNARGRDFEEDVSLVLRYDKHGPELVGDYDEIRRREYVKSLKHEPLYCLIVKEMQERDEWKVTSTELCQRLDEYGESIQPRGKSMKNKLQKLEQVLRGAGISWRRDDDSRGHTFRKIKVDIP